MVMLCFMSGERITSTGTVGLDLYRSEGRAYHNVDQRIGSLIELRELYEQSHGQALEAGRRRMVLRARCSRETFVEAMAIPATDPQALPIEAALPLVLLDPQQTDVILMLGKNVHPSLEEVPEWAEVYGYWQQPNGRSHGRNFTPPQRVEAVDSQRYQLINQPRPEHVDDLTTIWAAFGWGRAGVAEFIQELPEQTDQWFAGYMDRETGQLVSACMGESLSLANQRIVEGTEYGTLDGFEKQGLCTAAVVALHAQILNDTLYQTGEMPLIVSEFNMTSRSDVVGRHAGMTIPLVENSPHLGNTPFQVLRRNVSVIDHHPPTNIRWRDLNDRELRFREAYRHNHYRYWRNFIVGMLPQQTIATHYSADQVRAIMERFGR